MKNRNEKRQSVRGSTRMIAMFLAVLTLLFSVPVNSFGGQQNSYHDPAEHWVNSSNRTNLLDSNAVVTRETFRCINCKKTTLFKVFRTPEYTKDGNTALLRNVKYSDGMMTDGVTMGVLNAGTPGVDGYYTGYHWTKAVCEVCGSFNTNGQTDYCMEQNVYYLYDCSPDFRRELEPTVTFVSVDDEHHMVQTKGGEYCQYCYGTRYTNDSSLENHAMESKVTSEPGHKRFRIDESCKNCDYTATSYVGSFTSVSDYYGVADGQSHTVTVNDFSENGVKTKILFGETAASCELSQPPAYSQAGSYPVYYQITYSYGDTEYTEHGEAAVILIGNETEDDGACACGCKDPNCGCESENCKGDCCSDTCPNSHKEHDFIKLETVEPTCENGGYDRYICKSCGQIEKRNETDPLGHVWDTMVIRKADCEHKGRELHICSRCGKAEIVETPQGEHDYHYTSEPSTCISPGYDLKECSVCGDRHITQVKEVLGHDYTSTVIAPTCETMGYTIHTCTRCGDTHKDEPVQALGHQESGWIIDAEATQSREGSRHKECTVCGKILVTEAIPKIYTTATTDTHGEATVNGYLVIVTDTDTGSPVANATVILRVDGSIDVLLPDGRLIDYEDQTTVTVLQKADRSPVEKLVVVVSDRNDNCSGGLTDKNGSVTVPGTSGNTNSQGRTTIGSTDDANRPITLTVRVLQDETGRPIENAQVSIGRDGRIVVVLPDGVDMNDAHRIRVIVTDNHKNPQKDYVVIVRNDLGEQAEGKTDENGTVVVPEKPDNGQNSGKDAADPSAEQIHAAYIYGYPDGTVRPDGSMTRAEAAAVFARLLSDRRGGKIRQSAGSDFQDVVASDWYSGYLDYLTGYGIINGYGDGTFRPDLGITRSEFTTMAVRFFDSYGDGNPSIQKKYTGYRDVSDGYWAAEYIEEATRKGWVTGYEDGSFQGNKKIIRAEVVTLVNRLLGREADAQVVDQNLSQLEQFSDLRDPNYWAYYAIMEAANGHRASVADERETWNSWKL